MRGSFNPKPMRREQNSVTLDVVPLSDFVLGDVMLSVLDLPLAITTKALIRDRLLRPIVFSDVASVADAGVGATGSPAFRIFKNGIQVGTVTFAGTVGTVAFGDSIFPAGSLFELYPPSSVDATLDQVSITLRTT